jgi:RHS repeat-associated protein
VGLCGRSADRSTWLPGHSSYATRDQRRPARYLSGAQGRFQSVDPANAGANPADPQTWNAYSYVGNNPLSYSDPDGLGFWSALASILGQFIGIGVGPLSPVGGPPALGIPGLGGVNNGPWNEQPPSIALGPRAGLGFPGIGGSSGPWSEQWPGSSGFVDATTLPRPWDLPGEIAEPSPLTGVILGALIGWHLGGLNTHTYPADQSLGGPKVTYQDGTRGLPPPGVTPPVKDPENLKEGEASRLKEQKKGGKSLWDSKGGEWRYYPGDKWHNPHWDYNPHSSPASQWENVPIGDLPPRK